MSGKPVLEKANTVDSLISGEVTKILYPNGFPRSQTKDRFDGSPRADNSPIVEEQGTDFTVVLKRNSGENFGLEVDSDLHNFCIVVSISDGDIVDAYNRKAKPTRRIEPGDYIVMVNKITADQKDKMKVLQDEDQLELTISKCVRQEVAVPLYGDMKLGLDTAFRKEEQNYLMLINIRDGGAASVYNSSLSMGQKIKEYSRITAVNDVTGMALELTRALRIGTGAINLVLTSQADESGVYV